MGRPAGCGLAKGDIGLAVLATADPLLPKTTRPWRAPFPFDRRRPFSTRSSSRVDCSLRYVDPRLPSFRERGGVRRAFLRFPNERARPATDSEPCSQKRAEATARILCLHQRVGRPGGRPWWRLGQ